MKICDKGDRKKVENNGKNLILSDKGNSKYAQRVKNSHCWQPRCKGNDKAGIVTSYSMSLILFNLYTDDMRINGNGVFTSFK